MAPRGIWMAAVWASGICLCPAGEPSASTAAEAPLAITHYGAVQTGTADMTWCALQDRDGRVWIGTDGVVVGNGFAWRRVPTPFPLALVRALDEGPDGRIWVGAADTVGYFSDVAGGSPQFHDLTPTLPEGARPLGDVWHVFAEGARTVWVTHDQVLCREGEHWLPPVRFPGSKRLWGWRSPSGIWIQHRGTGIYRIDAGRPRLLLPDVPDHAFIAAGRDDGSGAMLLVTSAGLRRWDGRGYLPTAPALDPLIVRSGLSAAAWAPDGALWIATVDSGVALLRPGRAPQWLREGVPTPSASLLFDRAGGVWLPGRSHLARVAPSPVAGESPLRGVTALAGTQAGAYVVADGLAYLLKPGAAPIRLGGPGHYFGLTRDGTAVLATRPAGIDRLEAAGPVPVWSGTESERTLAFGAAAVEGGRIWVADLTGCLWRWAPGPDGRRRLVCIQAGMTPYALAPDPAGGVWLGAWRGGVGWAGPGDGPVAWALPRPAHSAPHPLVRRVGSQVVALVGNGVYSAQRNPLGLRLLARIPADRPLAAESDASGSRLFLAAERTLPDGRASAVLGWCDLAPEAGPAPWHELSVPALDLPGQISALAWDGAGPGGPRLWVGGSEGIVCVRLAAAQVATAPPRPFLDRVDASAPSSPGAPWRLPFAGNRLSLTFGLTDPGRTQRTWLETRLGDEAWSAPSPSPQVEFTHLREGSYVVQARWVDSSGAAGPVLTLPFAVLPPWYRSPWFEAMLALAGAGSIAGFFHLRQRELRRRERRLAALVKERTAQLERANAAKDEFVASISHEIRNPLNGIIGLTAALEATARDPGARHQLEMMRHCSEHLSSLIEEVLDFARIEAGAVAVATAPFGLAPLLESVRAVMAEASAAAGIPLDLVIGPEVPAQVAGDAAKIRQVLINYVANALNYAGRGRIRIAARATAMPSGRWDLDFSVADEGPGIAPHEQEKLFAKFQRGEAARGRSIPGSGLGLALCRSLAERMGGATFVRSEPGRGATFHLRLPLAEAAPEPARPEPGNLPVRAALPVLVVEDQEFNSAGLEAMLSALGARPRVAASAEAALEALAAGAYALVLIDRDLPGMSGLDLARRIRTGASARPRPWLVATTGATTLEAIRACEDAGMDRFLAKPITPDKLRRLLADLCGWACAAPPVQLPWRIDTLRYVAGGDGPELRRRMRLYAGEFDALLSELEAALAAGDFERVRRGAHRVVAHLAVIEHAALVVAAQQLEEAAVNRDGAGAAALWNELRAGVRLLRLSLLAAAENAPAA